MSASGKRRSPEEIIDAFFDVLPVNSQNPLSVVARKAGLDWKTAARYCKLILHIQSKPKLIEGKVGDRKAYRRQKK